MACNDINPCNPPCDPCTQNCHDDCGCVTKNTFNCNNYTGSLLPCINVENGDDGNEVLTKINTVICTLQENKGKILVDGTDTCPENLIDKLQAGLNVSFSVSGTGCDRRLTINSTTGGVPVDVNVKVTSNDTTSGYLDSKVQGGTYIQKTILNPGGNEVVKLDILPTTLISSDSGNQLTLGVDGKLKTLYTAPDGSETKLIAGAGVTISGTGTLLDPYIASINPSITALRPCFDGVWRDFTFIPTGNTDVVFNSGLVKFRYRYDGSIEFKGTSSYTVSFGNYQSSTRRFLITLGSLPTGCVTLSEQNGTMDLKNVVVIDVPQASSDQITQMYNYTIRKLNNNIQLELQSSFTNATSKTIVVSFDGCITHPNL